MKKATLALLVVIAFSCQNENTVNPRPVDEVLGTATISGKAQADTNEETVGLENVPDGTIVFATINTADLELNPSGGVTYPNRNYQTTVSGGAYSFTNIDVGVNGINVDLTFSDFRSDFVDVTATDTTTIEDQIFTGVITTVTVLPGETTFFDATY